MSHLVSKGIFIIIDLLYKCNKSNLYLIHKSDQYFKLRYCGVLLQVEKGGLVFPEYFCKSPLSYPHSFKPIFLLLIRPGKTPRIFFPFPLPKKERKIRKDEKEKSGGKTDGKIRLNAFLFSLLLFWSNAQADLTFQKNKKINENLCCTYHYG